MILWDTNILIDFWKNPKELNKLNISKDKHSVFGIKYDIPVWTKDYNFRYIQSIYPELRLYEEKI